MTDWRDFYDDDELAERREEFGIEYNEEADYLDLIEDEKPFEPPRRFTRGPEPSAMTDR